MLEILQGSFTDAHDCSRSCQTARRMWIGALKILKIVFALGILLGDPYVG